MKKKIFFLLVTLLVVCEKQNINAQMKKHRFTNNLIHETSPYLLQHAHNPVNWRAWNAKTLQLAKEQNKLLIISIGYAACHWCHVMEEESFKNEEVAELMNKNFISIKVDREELPNVDQTYMAAVQLLTGSGGWPLNCIALPNGKPIWGGTYFSKEQWIEILEKIIKLNKTEPDKVYEFAQKITKGIKNQNIIEPNLKKAQFTKTNLENAVTIFMNSLDEQFGGRKGSPKFPMPVNLEFLLRYGVQSNNKRILKYVNTSLTKMAYGGIYDQVEGGFSRYSTDEKWHIPHFEKMLYDNAQLVSLYSKAYRITQKELYKKIVLETLNFVKKELTNKEGVFYTSLDADSFNEEGELKEGAYYTFTQKELKYLIGKDYPLFKDYFNTNEYGHWEYDKYVLIRNQDNDNFVKKHFLTKKELEEKLIGWKKILIKYKNQRKKPRLDDKALTSWNALMIKAYIEAYHTFGNESFLQAALKNATFIVSHQLKPSGVLYRNYKKGKSTINGFLEDYAMLIDSFIAIYETTFDEKWLQLSKKLMEYTITHFYNPKNGLFFFTHNNDNSLINRSVEVYDNVIPSSNSIMAQNLFRLSHHFYDTNYLKMSKKMLNNVKEKALQYPSSYANWLQLGCNYTYDFYEVSIIGENAKNWTSQIYKKYIPNKIVAGSIGKSSVPLLKDRFNKEKTLIYVCVNGVCKMPSTSVQNALSQLGK